MSNHSNSTPFTSWGRERATSGARAGPGGGQHAPPRPADPRPNNLYVKGLPEHWTDDHLRTLFEPCGAVLSCRVLVDKGGVSKKCGYVQLSTTATAAAAATSALNGVALTPSAPPLAVLPAASRVERRAEAAAARAARLATVLAPRPVAGGGALVLGPGGRAYQPPPVGEETAAAAVAVATGPAFVAAALGRGKQGGREE